ncbi:ribosomal biogenesis GTPase [Spiroplasma clarkii]|uniref:Ribosome biogenesis GTPase A n=1 Tax=Spiroplasma clarkii TaxID=2139 RepID=A0A1Y0L1V7_9MOLU|nr:ribosome biogenesis GTPase YlqF [Spiroplasma clarkii]ARU92004.1 ribosomal biogenesis GTPase [Spiroplasma clarkii]ATX71337.1 ribosomal biogenesis GTPase [Spiroplasma clarkii]
MADKSTFNWFPGHMNKSIKAIEEMISIVDLVIEIVDARAPFSTQNPIFKKLLTKSPKLVLLSKGDLADSAVTSIWIDYFKKQGDNPYLIKNKQHDIYNDILKLINQMTKPKQEKQKQKGIEKPQLNILVVGIPNVGKSTVIGKLCKGKQLKIANRPGVTVGLHRIKMTDQITLIDSPGILPTKFENETTACNCAAVNSIRLDVVPKERFATKLMRYLYNSYPNLIENKYKISHKILRPIDYDDTFKIFEEIAKVRKFTVFDEVLDFDKAINLFITDLMAHNFGPVSFEKPIEIDKTSSFSIDKKDIDKIIESDLTVEW